MSRQARRWAAAAALTLLLAGGALAFGQVTGTFAIFTADTENPNAAANGSWIPAASAPGSGSNAVIGGTGNGQAVLNWTSGHSAGTPSPNPVTGQAVAFLDGGSTASANCTGTYGSPVALGFAITTDTLTGTPFTDWWCYEVYSTSTSSGNWTSDPYVLTAVRPLVPTQVQFAGNGDGNLSSGDTIVITFNQNVSLSGSPVDVCTEQTNVIAIGVSGCAAGTTGTVGTITGFNFIKRTNKLSATISAPGNTNQITVTLTATGKAVTTQSGEAFTAGSADVASTGGWTACTAAACLGASVSGSF